MQAGGVNRSGPCLHCRADYTGAVSGRYGGAMTEFVSEAIDPWPGSFDAAAMGRAEPGLPRGFHWRGDSFATVQVLERWKESGASMGELYLRRHYFRVRMADDSIWTLYCLRQTPQSGSPKRRWFLYTVD